MPRFTRGTSCVCKLILSLGHTTDLRVEPWTIAHVDESGGRPISLFKASGALVPLLIEVGDEGLVAHEDIPRVVLQILQVNRNVRDRSLLKSFSLTFRR